MIQKLFLAVVVTASILATVSGECANACNGHGKCTSYDMCICNRNWQASDCSERVCQFGLAHVDTPKGDLDASGTVTGPTHQVVDNSFLYPYGTTEQFPQMLDSDLQVLENSAHFYMECSNKGTCDRATGQCICYDGYDGVACQRASCPGFPNSCSGHGVCKTKRQLAAADNGNVYQLWDKHVSMGCECDPGYTGPDCSQRQCKHGIDPLYLDDSATVKFSTWDVAILTTATTIDFTNGFAQPGTGHWAIRYYDSHGEDWVTEPIHAGATCASVVDALESLPNNVVPSGYTYCTRTSHTRLSQNAWQNYDAQHPKSSSHPYLISYNMSIWEAGTPANQGESSYYTAVTDYSLTTGLSGYIYRLKFYGNPGALREPEVEIYLDGKRPSLVSSTANAKVITKVWTDGQQGEDNDYFADYCSGVSVTVTHAPSLRYHYLNGMTAAEIKLFKKCLGPSDFDSSNNIDVYNWDKGTELYPHIIKLVRATTVYTDGGYYAVIWYDTSSAAQALDLVNAEGIFRLVNPFTPPDNFATDVYTVYTTTGTLALTSNATAAVFSFASRSIYTVNSTYDVSGTPFDGDISCEVGDNNAEKFKYIFHCLNKTDLFTVLNWEAPQYNPPHINLYTADRIFTTPTEHVNIDRYYRAAVQASTVTSARNYYDMHYMTHVITTDLSTNWEAHITTYGYPEVQGGGYYPMRVYKFFPATSSTYNYVNECSNRGLCNRDTGTCNCFPGYTNDDCSVQNSIAL